MMGPRPQYYISCHKVTGPLVLEKKIFEGFLPLWAWRPSWSCEPDPANKLLFPYPTEAPYEIWLRLAKWFWRRRSLKMVDGQMDGRRTPNAGPWLYYKLTNEPKGLGELTITAFFFFKILYPGLNSVSSQCACGKLSLARKPASIPNFFNGKKLFKNVTLQILNFTLVS